MTCRPMYVRNHVESTQDQSISKRHIEDGSIPNACSFPESKQARPPVRTCQPLNPDNGKLSQLSVLEFRHNLVHATKINP